ncbi:SusC/RagA family TonB-linked outer membrane protein [Pseudoflavitalea sp. X16]|uniref:SusC/RagA family TonB-linked outer membrane protein n=1 Tax=Paraflavitalea devenefica TaxID=2716334 RepID=UPI00141E66CE|nr:SusC/RagA family TonB-linked outer membrane protein [Paraflavitalea devenefica]NII26779.1 SusC/RagA family TonB-linked outer membrane protein [Paraflavitalea devenefica]
MRLTFFFLMVATLGVHASGHSQSISLSGKDIPARQVFSAIEKQTGYVIFYNNSLLDETALVTLDVSQMPLEKFLELYCSKQSLNYRITNRMITFYRKIIIPEPPFLNLDAFRNIYTGRVLNATSKEPLAGATITVKGKESFVITDSKGSFKMETDPGTILIISFVGYQSKEIKLDANKADITVMLEPQAEKLSETVVTAYGIEKSQKEIGYSAVKISGEEINRANSGNLLTGLAGKVSGLNIATQSADMNPQMRVLLRGIRSFGENSNNQPLFILNGTPLSFGSDIASASLVMDFINNINPADIENVTVLKGANGTALYGPEGVNGVIIITTKKGQKGKPVISFRNNVSFQRMDYRNDNSLQRRYGTGMGTVDANGNGVYSLLDRNGWGPAYNGELVKIGRPDENGEYQMVTYSDKKDARRFFRVASIVQNNLSVSQSDAVSDFYIGLNHVHQEGYIPGDKQNALSVFFSGGRKFGKLQVQLNLNYSRTTTDGGPEMQYIGSYPTFIPVLSYKDYENNKWADNNHYWSDQEVMSPYQVAKNNRSVGTSNALAGGLIITMKVLPWLTITEKPGIVYNGAYEKTTQAPVYFSDFAKQYGGWNRYRDQLAQLKEDTRTLTSLNNDLLITALNQAGNFTFRTTIGNSIRESYSKKMGGSGNPIVPVYNLIFSRDQPYGSEEALLTRFYSVFGTAGIGYRDRVFVELMARNDWDSKRASIARGKDLYVGANTSVILNEVIPSLKEISWLSRLQLRGAVNGTANMNIEPYQAERTLMLAFQNYFPYPGTIDDGVLSYQFLADIPNPYLKPEKILSQEYGMAIGLWKDRVVADFSFYTQRNNGVIMKVKTPWLSGASTLDNLGVLRNSGWELDLKFNPIFKLNNGLTLTADFRMAMNTNKVLSISDVYEGVFPLKTPYWGSMYGIVARPGQTAFEYQLFDWKRDPAGRIIVNKQTGMPETDRDSAHFTGRSLPKYTGGININLSWKGLSLAVLGEFNLGAWHYYEKGTLDVMNGMHVLTTYNDRKPYVIPNSSYLDASGKYVDNTDIKVKNANKELYSRFENTSTLYIAKADFLKIREIVLSYERNLKTKVIKRFQVSIYGRNVFNFYSKGNKSGDPQLIKGPGGRGYRTIPDNLTGSASGISTVPGIVQYGVITTLNF